MAADPKSNEEIFIENAVNNQGFRDALKSGDRKTISDALKDIGVQVSDKDKEAVLDAIEKIDWEDLKRLEEALLGGVQPLN